MRVRRSQQAGRPRTRLQPTTVKAGALAEVARGPADAWLTKQAHAALDRLKQGKGLALP
jgi:hypothetical protein